MMKRYRLDMFYENAPDGRDDVEREINEEENPEPVVDVFDELLGDTFPSSNQSAPVVTNPTPVSYATGSAYVIQHLLLYYTQFFF